MADSVARGSYATIVADPPWPYESGFVSYSRTEGKWSKRLSKPLPYPAMTLPEIVDLPVMQLASRDCGLWLWATNRFLPTAFACFDAWGFTYAQTLVWHKTKFGSPFGGSVAPNRAEFLLYAKRGHPKLSGRWEGGSVLSVPGMSGRRVGYHSRKPDVFLDEIERVSSGPRLEMFARRQRLGWDTWGNEALNHVEMAS